MAVIAPTGPLSAVWIAPQLIAAAAASPAAPVAEGNRRDARRARAQERERLRPLQKELAAVESKIAEHDARKAEIAAELEKPEVSSDAERLLALTQEYQTLDRESDKLFTRWEELSTQLETLQSGE